MPRTHDEDHLAPEQRDGRPVEERAAGEPDDTDQDIPDDQTIENVGY